MAYSHYCDRCKEWVMNCQHDRSKAENKAEEELFINPLPSLADVVLFSIDPSSGEIVFSDAFIKALKSQLDKADGE